MNLCQSLNSIKVVKYFYLSDKGHMFEEKATKGRHKGPKPSSAKIWEPLTFLKPQKLHWKIFKVGIHKFDSQWTYHKFEEPFPTFLVCSGSISGLARKCLSYQGFRLLWYLRISKPKPQNITCLGWEPRSSHTFGRSWDWEDGLGNISQDRKSQSLSYLIKFSNDTFQEIDIALPLMTNIIPHILLS